MSELRCAEGLFERLAFDAQGSRTLGAFRRKLVEAVQDRFGAESAAIIDPLGGPASGTSVSRIAGTGQSAGYAELFVSNERRYFRSLQRFVRVIEGGPAIDTDVYGSSERRRLTAYAELFLPQRATCILASAVRYRARDVSIIVMKRHGRTAPFRSHDAEALRALLPAIGLAEAGFRYSLSAPAGRCESWRVLSEREVQVCELACKGMRNAEIAALLGTHRDTVKKQLRSVTEKMNVSNRTELAMLWASSGNCKGQPRSADF